MASRTTPLAKLTALKSIKSDISKLAFLKSVLKKDDILIVQDIELILSASDVNSYKRNVLDFIDEIQKPDVEFIDSLLKITSNSNKIIINNRYKMVDGPIIQDCSTSTSVSTSTSTNQYIFDEIAQVLANQAPEIVKKYKYIISDNYQSIILALQSVSKLCEWYTDFAPNKGHDTNAYFGCGIVTIMGGVEINKTHCTSRPVSSPDANFDDFIPPNHDYFKLLVLSELNINNKFTTKAQLEKLLECFDTDQAKHSAFFKTFHNIPSSENLHTLLNMFQTIRYKKNIVGLLTDNNYLNVDNLPDMLLLFPEIYRYNVLRHVMVQQALNNNSLIIDNAENCVKISLAVASKANVRKFLTDVKQLEIFDTIQNQLTDSICHELPYALIDAYDNLEFTIAKKWQNCKIVDVRKNIFTYNPVNNHFTTSEKYSTIINGKNVSEMGWKECINVKSPNNSNIKKYSLIVNYLTKCEELKLVQDVVATNEKKECKICMENQKRIVLECGHIFCASCTTQLLKTTNLCPTCRQGPIKYCIIRDDS